MRSFAAHSGFSIIELLISIFILSFAVDVLYVSKLKISKQISCHRKFIHYLLNEESNAAKNWKKNLKEESRSFNCQSGLWQ